jgi:hypothetical protein
MNLHSNAKITKRKGYKFSLKHKRIKIRCFMLILVQEKLNEMYNIAMSWIKKYILLLILLAK